MIPLRTQYLMSLAQLLFPVWVDDGLDSHKAFIIRYATGEDLDLEKHVSVILHWVADSDCYGVSKTQERAKRKVDKPKLK